MSSLKFPQLTLPQHPQRVGLCLAILALVMRLPYFFEAVIDWDESTFILLGQSVVDGHLPYTELLDAKPPLLWTSFALFIWLFGKTVVSIRLAGTICVVLTAYLTYLIGRQIWNHHIGVISGILCVIVTGLSSSGQAVMSEHIALVPLMASLTLLITRHNTLRNLFVVGAFLTTASLIRLNLVYVVVAVGLAIAFYPPMTSNQLARYRVYQSLAYALGGVTVLSLTFIPYLMVGQDDIWWSGVVRTSLSYSNSQNTILITLIQQIGTFLLILIGRPSIAFSGVAILVWLGGLFQIYQTSINWKKLPTFQQRNILILFINLISIEVSILASGIFHPHYMIQFNPIFALFATVFIQELLLTQYQYTIKKFTIFVLLVACIHISSKYVVLGYEVIYNNRLLYGSAYQIAQFLKQENLNKEPVLLLDNHLVYWLTNTKPLSAAMTHPSNINKEFLLKTWFGKDASTATELSKIMTQKPKFIIGDDIASFFNEPVQTQFALIVSKHYKFVKKIDTAEVFQRSDPKSSP